MQKLGQHFLKNATVLEAIVAAIAPDDGDRIVEIGPGHGELTAPLLRAARGKTHCEIFCIEKDRSLVAGLRSFAPHATIVEGDALKLLPEIAGNIPQCKIAGNIPYYITGKLLRVVSELERRPERTVLLVQKEVAERIRAAPPAMNRLAASVQFWANAAIVARVPRNDFTPPPDVDSAVIVLDRKPGNEMSAIDPALYYKAVRAIFAQPRKTILNNVAAAGLKAPPKEDVANLLHTIGIDPNGRPQNITIDAIIALANTKLWG